MMENRKRITAVTLFSVTLILIISAFIFSLVKTDRFNKTMHYGSYIGSDLFKESGDKDADVSVRAAARTSIWLIALLIFCITEVQYIKYRKQHDHDNEIIKSHTIHGSEILSHFKSLPNVNEGARYHHERYDGKGYPEGKKGDEIPLIARIICVADSFDAMNSNRVYRKKLTKDDIVNEIEKNKGTQFDPEIADIFLKLLKNGKIGSF